MKEKIYYYDGVNYSLTELMNMLYKEFIEEFGDIKHKRKFIFSSGVIAGMLYGVKMAVDDGYEIKDIRSVFDAI